MTTSKETIDAIREHVQAAGPAGIGVLDLLTWVRNSFPGQAITSSWLSMLLDNGVEAGWYVDYGPGQYRDGVQVDVQTFVAAEHARSSAAEVLQCIAAARRVGQRREDLAGWLAGRYPAGTVRLDQLDWWLGELTGSRQAIPYDRNGKTYFVAAEHADTGPRELSRLRLPVNISEFTRWLNMADQVHAKLTDEYGKTSATTDHIRRRRIGDDVFMVFYDRPADDRGADPVDSPAADPAD